MSSRTLLAGAFVVACLGLSACTGRQILSMRAHPAARPTAGIPQAPQAAFTGTAMAATTDYPKNANAPRPQPPAEYANLKSPLQPTAARPATSPAQTLHSRCARRRRRASAGSARFGRSARMPAQYARA